MEPYGGALGEGWTGKCRNCGNTWPEDENLKVSDIGPCWIDGHDWDLVGPYHTKWRQKEKGWFDDGDDLPDDLFEAARSHPAHTFRTELDVRTPLTWGENDTMMTIAVWSDHESAILTRVHGVRLQNTNVTSSMCITLDQYLGKVDYPDPDVVLPLPTILPFNEQWNRGATYRRSRR